MEEKNKAIISEEEVRYTTNTSEQQESEESTPVTTQETSEVEIKPTEEFVKPKKPLFMKILFGVIIFLLLLLITGIVLYFTGFFEPKEEPKKDESMVSEVVTKTEPAPVVENNPKFEIKDINSKKLNEQLANLTNKNIPEEKKNIQNEKKKEELLKQKAIDDEKKNLENEKIQQQTQIKEEIKVDNQKEKPTMEPSSAEDKKNLDNDTLSKDTTSTDKTKNNNIKEEKTEKITKENSSNNQFLLFVNVVKIKGELYKKYLDKIIAIDPNVKLCRDEKNRIEIYFGPFEKSEDRTELLNKLLKNKFTEAYPLEFTKEEFDKRCNY